MRVRDRAHEIPGLAKRFPAAQPALGRVTDLVRWFEPPIEDEKSAAERLLEGQRDVLARLEALRPALTRKEAVWPVKKVDFRLPEGVEFPSPAEEMIRLRWISDAFGEAAVLHMAAGDADAAADCVDAMLDIARLELESKPAVLSLVLADVVLKGVGRAIWEGVVRESWNESHLGAFEAELAALDPQAAALRSHLGEIAFARASTTMLLALVPDDAPKVESDWKDGWAWDRQTIRERIHELWLELRPPGLAVLEVVRARRIYLKHATSSGGAPRSGFTHHNLAVFRANNQETDRGSAFVFTSGWDLLESLVKITLQTEATISLVRSGIALERHRIERGGQVRSLEELVPAYLPAVPRDPFDGKPLRHRLQADGSPHVWSVGENLADDGGVPSRSSDRGDLIWITRPIPGFTERDFNSR